MILALGARNFGANRVRLVINRMPKRAQMQLPELERIMGHSIYGEIPNDYGPLNDAYSEPRLLDAGSGLAEHIGRLAARLVGIEEQEQKPKRFFGLRSKK
jgi:Flp pilus assembly CpaE family ATPase